MDCSILVVDDNETVRAVVVDILDDAGFQVTEAGSGDAALSFLRSSSATQLLLTDIMMPGMNGIELAGRARLLHPLLPVVLMTGFAKQQTPDGIQVLQKPFRAKELLAAVYQELQLAMSSCGV